MSVRLKVPTQLRQLTGGAAELDVEAASIRELLEKVGGDHPELLERVLDEGGEIRRFVNLYVGDEDVRFLEGIDTPLKDGEVVVILPAVAGIRVPFGRGFYLPLAALHLSLAVRLAGGWWSFGWRSSGALLNAVAIVLFAATVIAVGRSARITAR